MEEEGGLSIADTRSDNSATWRCNAPMAAVIPLNAWARSAGEKSGCSPGTVAETMGAVMVTMAAELTGVVTDGLAAEEGGGMGAEAAGADMADTRLLRLRDRRL